MRTVIATLVAAYLLAACGTGRTLDGDSDAAVEPTDDLGDETWDWGDDPPPPGEGEDDPLPEEDGGVKPPEVEPWPEDAGEPPDPEPPPEDDAGALPGEDASVPFPEDASTPLPGDCHTGAGPLNWSCDGPIAGQHCVNVNEPSDRDGWSDNHVCSTVDMGLRWSHSGPIAGMRCTAINEPGDPAGWSDNHLCLPSDSPFTVGWSAAGPIPGRLCFPVVEPSESPLWSDNHLCVWWNLNDPDPPPLPRYRAVFSSRSGTNTADGAVEDAIVDLIERAVPASRVRVAVFRFTRSRPATALIQAAQRGVDVRVVVDGDADEGAGSEVPRLISMLGRSRVTVCGAPGSACVGTGIMHHKTFLFSQLDDGSRNVVVQASHNLTHGQLTRHNNAVIVRGDSNLFAAYERAFADLRRDVVRAGYYRVANGNFRTRGYYFPRDSGDTVAGVIDGVSCAGTARIRVAMAFFTDARLQVARALARRAQAGCDVQAVIGNAGLPAGRRVLEALRGGGVRVTLYPARGGNWALHSKYLLIDARYAGSSANRRLVFTGSHNWTGGALRRNDETLLRVENDDVFAAFMADWAHVRESAGRR